MVKFARLGPLGDRPFRVFFAGRLVSLLGSAFAPIALAFAVLDLTGKASDLGIVLASREVPQVVLMLAGGVLADRWRRLRVMVVCNIVAAASQGATAALLLNGSATLWELCVLAGVNGAAIAFFYPASAGIVPELVERERWQTANALLRLARSTTAIGGATAAGLVVAALGPGWGIAADAISFALSAAILSRLKTPSIGVMSRSRFISELRTGWREFASRTWLWVIVVQFSAVNAANAAGFLLLGPVVASRRLGGAAAWGFVLAAQSVGLVLGGVVAMRWRPKHPLYAATLTVFLMALPMAALASGQSTPLIAIAAGISGLGMEQFGVQWSTTMQHRVPLDRLSRVTSYDALGSFVFIPVGYAVGGAMAATIGVATTIWVSAATVVIATGLALLSRDIRHLPRSDEPLDRVEDSTPAAAPASLAVDIDPARSRAPSG